MHLLVYILHCTICTVHTSRYGSFVRLGPHWTDKKKQQQKWNCCPRTHTHTHAHIHTHTPTPTHTCTQTNTHTHTHTPTHTHPHPHTHIHTHTHMYTNQHTHTPRHTHIRQNATFARWYSVLYRHIERILAMKLIYHVALQGKWRRRRRRRLKRRRRKRRRRRHPHHCSCLYIPGVENIYKTGAFKWGKNWVNEKYCYTSMTVPQFWVVKSIILSTLYWERSAGTDSCNKRETFLSLPSSEGTR